MASVHLGFDMGIRNLAFCLIRHEPDNKWNVIAWDNIDLLEGGVSSQGAKKCVACTGAATWIGPDKKKWCKACATQTRVKKTATEKPGFPTLACGFAVKGLRELASAKGVADWKKMKKDDLIAWASAGHLVPWKPVKATDSAIGLILAAMDKWLDSVLPTFAAATLIRLENQPALKIPTMKSVQMILYTLLSHRLAREHGWGGRIEFVHAGVKTRGLGAAAPAPAADAAPAPAATPAAASKTAEDTKAYHERKATAEAETVRHLTAQGAESATWLTYFQGKSKKSDLADAFLMALRSSV
jgi:hypothetical protein